MRLLLLVSALALGCSTRAVSQTLFTYGTHQVSKEEFLRAYNKNNSAASNDDQSYRDYLSLYTKFKLKVQAALDQKLDTLASQKAELENFRQQVLPSFLDTEGFMQQLVDEAFDRSQNDLHLAHIYIPFTGNDTSAAFRKTQEAYKALQGGEDFGAVAQKFSGDPAVASNNGDLGFITVLTLPYQLESIAYNTPVSKFSSPVKSKSAYHIFKVIEQRPSIGRMRIAQIFIAFPPAATSEIKAQKKQLADSLSAEIARGSSFSKLAEKFSQDNASYLNSGIMPEFGAGRFDRGFEDAVFALDHDSAVSKPIAAADGYHIVKRLSRIAVPATKDNDFYGSLKQQVANDSRRELAHQMQVRMMYTRLNAKRYPVNLAHVVPLADSLAAKKKAPKFTDVNAQTPLFVVKGKSYTVTDWARFEGGTRGLSEDRSPGLDSLQLAVYMDNMVNEAYRNNLEIFNPEFGRQMQEFKEGNLLFEVMQRNVWDKAGKDKAGMQQYYKAHKDKYWWEPSVDAVLFNTNSIEVAKAMRDTLSANPSAWKKMLKGHETDVQADSGRYEVAQLPLNDHIVPAVHTFSSPFVNSSDNSATFIYVTANHSQKEIRNFEDAKGFVLNDYQVVLEERWIQSLQKRYPVKVNDATLASLSK